jgi:predicted histone-like DNA-binding protein
MAASKTKKKTYAIPITENQVFYSTVKRPNPKDKNKTALYYAQVHHSARATLSTLQDRLTQMSALSRGDVQSVLSNLLDVIKEQLRNGRIVELGELGSLYIGINSKGVANEKDFTSAQIKSGHINFRAGKDLKSVMKSLSFLKLSEDTGATTSDTKSGGKSDGTGSGNSGGSTGGNTGGDSDGGKI